MQCALRLKDLQLNSWREKKSSLLSLTFSGEESRWRVRGFSVEFGWLNTVMDGSRRWFMESKEFELVLKGGASGVRIYERSHGKQRSIFLKIDELAWMGRTVGKMIAVESLEVFWDQARAGYP